MIFNGIQLFLRNEDFGNSSKIPFFTDFDHLNTVSNKSSSCEIEEMSFNISNLSIFRPSTSYNVKQTVSEGCNNNEVYHNSNYPFSGDYHGKS